MTIYHQTVFSTPFNTFGLLKPLQVQLSLLLQFINHKELERVVLMEELFSNTRIQFGL